MVRSFQHPALQLNRGDVRHRKHDLLCSDEGQLSPHKPADVGGRRSRPIRVTAALKYVAALPLSYPCYALHSRRRSAFGSENMHMSQGDSMERIPIELPSDWDLHSFPPSTAVLSFM